MLRLVRALGRGRPHPHPRARWAAAAAAGAAAAAASTAALAEEDEAPPGSLLAELVSLEGRLGRVEATLKRGHGTLIVVGESLIDFIPGDDGRFLPRCGGAPFNVCLTMARLDAPTAFLSNVSTDMFGAQICAELGKDNVDLSMVGRVPNPSTLAFVSFATGEPQYAFFFNDAADRSLTPATLPPLPYDAAAVHLSMGAITLEVEPVSSAFGALLDERCDELFTSFDPNIRDQMIPDASRYRSLLLDKWLAKFDLVKVSDADLAYLYGVPEAELDLDAIAAEWLEKAPAMPLLLITRGAQGTVAYRPGKPKIAVALDPVVVSDTVGAGDSYMGAFLVSLREKGALEKGVLAKMEDESLEETMAFAAKVAAVTCTRAGADPPTLAEVS